MKLAIKNMVCQRCVTAVENILQTANIPFKQVELGKIEFQTNPSSANLQIIDIELQKIGFEIITDNKLNTVNSIKLTLLDYLNNHIQANVKLSTFISDKLNISYQLLSTLFSEHEQLTIEKYFIQLKIEKVKELLSYNEMNLKEIAFGLNYSSLAHLSKQFKEITGITPTEFKNRSDKNRQTLDSIGNSASK